MLAVLQRPTQLREARSYATTISTRLFQWRNLHNLNWLVLKPICSHVHTFLHARLDVLLCDLLLLLFRLNLVDVDRYLPHVLLFLLVFPPLYFIVLPVHRRRKREESVATSQSTRNFLSFSLNKFLIRIYCRNLFTWDHCVLYSCCWWRCEMKSFTCFKSPNHSLPFCPVHLE